MSETAHHPAQPGLLLVLSAPSGAGKTTLSHRLMQDLPDGALSVSYTTRSPRGQERDGKDYHFVDVATFQQKIERGEFIEWAEVYGQFYGTPRAPVDEARARRGVVIFDIDVQGGHAIKRRFPDAVLIYILPPALEELERRLRERKTDSDETIRRRMLAARSEIERGCTSYDYLVINDDIERAFLELRSVVIAERCRRGRVDLSGLHLDLDGSAGPG